MSRTAASYKLRYGVAKTLKDELLEELQTCVFSLNIDEATSKTDMKVLTVLVNHFSSSHRKLMVHHLASLKLIKVTAESLFAELAKLFESLNLPWVNLLSVMMDSCSVMRGSKGGLETLIRERKAPQLLDIDGDSCHHLHNASKQFCSAFGGEVEKLLNDLHTDFKWCSEHKELLADLCLILGIKPSAPSRYVPHRWLSILDVSKKVLHLKDALTLFYFSFLDAESRAIYGDIVEEVFKGVEESGVQAAKKIQQTLSKKQATFTAEGKERKKRMVGALFTRRPQILLTLMVYDAVLPDLQGYVKTFQTKAPMVHLLNTKQQQFVENFLSLFQSLSFQKQRRKNKRLPRKLKKERKLCLQRDVPT